LNRLKLPVSDLAYHRNQSLRGRAQVGLEARLYPSLKMKTNRADFR
jgi:hypothetical protein